MNDEGAGGRLLCAVAVAAVSLARPIPVRAADEVAGIETATDRELASEARLSTILRVIGERNADLREVTERAHAAEARTGASARLPDPELKGELWGVPLTHPVGFDQAQTIMIGLRQSFPAWGSLDARERAAREDASGAGDAIEARRQEIAAQARRAFAAYARADREYRIHLEHVGLTSRVVEIARSLYQVGHGSQQDLLRVAGRAVAAARRRRRHRAAATLGAGAAERAHGSRPGRPLGPAPGRMPSADAIAAAEPPTSDADAPARRSDVRSSRPRRAP